MVKYDYAALSRVPIEKVLRKKLTITSVKATFGHLSGLLEYAAYFCTLGKVNYGHRRYNNFAEMIFWISDIKISEDGRKLTILIERNGESIRIVLCPSRKSITFCSRDIATGTESVFDSKKAVDFYTTDLDVLKYDIAQLFYYIRYNSQVNSFVQSNEYFYDQDDHASGAATHL